MKTQPETDDLFRDKNQPPIVTIKHSELFGWHQRAQTGELHIQRMKCVIGGYELSVLWLNGRKLKTFDSHRPPDRLEVE